MGYLIENPTPLELLAESRPKPRQREPEPPKKPRHVTLIAPEWGALFWIKYNQRTKGTQK